ncbi:MAG: tRNA pseudouridine synthase A [Phycisphaerales bacterium]|nr:tRNA pseudouridine synthase A [Phycisphaerales bacterium]
MPRYKLTIAYDGTDFCGWQKQEPYAPDAHTDDPSQPHPGQGALEHAQTLGLREGETRPRVALRTVQHVVEQGVRAIVGEEVDLVGASRTDAGVHARGQVAAFTCSDGEGTGINGPRTGWPLSRGVDKLLRAINGKLPQDVQVMHAEPVEESFEPISGALEKCYTYTFHVSPPPPRGTGLRPLWDRRYVHRVWEPLDATRMDEAARRLEGTHDFLAFTTINHGRLTTVRTVTSCRVMALAPVPEGDRVRVEVRGGGFLYNMVRIIAGTLFEVGRGSRTPDDVSAALASRERRQAGPTLAPAGLCLEWIRYT